MVHVTGPCPAVRGQDCPDQAAVHLHRSEIAVTPGVAGAWSQPGRQRQWPSRLAVMRHQGMPEPSWMVLQVIGPRPAGHQGEAPGQAEAELSSKLKHPNIVETLMFNSFRADKVGGLLHHQHGISSLIKSTQGSSSKGSGRNSTLSNFCELPAAHCLTACKLHGGREHVRLAARSHCVKPSVSGPTGCMAAFESSAGVRRELGRSRTALLPRRLARRASAAVAPKMIVPCGRHGS